MKKQEKIHFIQHTLNSLFPNPQIPLQHKDTYTLLIAVVLSAQCTDDRVNKITPLLFAKADNPFAMVKLDVAEIKEIIKPCGLSPAKSKAIFGLSEILVNTYKGTVPNTFQELEALPGVGHKTASVIMSQAYGVPAFPVDTHIHRLAQRWGITKKNASISLTERDLKKNFPEQTWNLLHLQIIYFGRSYCPARGHNIAQCPICSVVTA